MYGVSVSTLRFYHVIRWNVPFLPPRRRRVACDVSEAAASACHDTMLGAKAPGNSLFPAPRTPDMPDSHPTTSGGMCPGCCAQARLFPRAAPVTLLLIK